MSTIVVSDKDKFLVELENQDFSGESKDFIKVREASLAHLKELDFPTKKLEAWKYTSVKEITKKSFKPQAYVNLSKLQVQPFLLPDAYHLVFVNGKLNTAFSSFKSEQEGLTLLNISQAKQSQKDKITPFYAQIAKNKDDFFVNLNTAFAQDGAFVHVAKNLKVAKLVQVLHLSYGEELSVMPRNIILAEKNSSINVVFTYAGLDSKEVFVNALTEVNVEEGAEVFVDKIQEDTSDVAYHIHLEQVKVAKNANFVINTISLAGEFVRNNLNIHLLGTGSNADLYAPIVLNGKKHLDNQTFVEHVAPNCTSNELYKCVVLDEAINVFNGKILVQQTAQKTNAFQSNANIILSDNAKTYAKPQLEIYADDVKCSHGCTVGQFDEAALFYLRARGISKKTAQKVLLEAFVGEVLEHIPSETVKAYVSPKIFNNFTSNL